MHGEGQKVQRRQDSRQISFAVAKIMFEVVTLGFQDVERLVLDFPSGPAAVGEFRDRGGVYGQVGDEAVAVGDVARGVDDLDLN